jgi:galactose mutarotase-like enzyme
MSSPSVTHATLEGFAAVRVHTGPLALSLLPELGGKISSLRDEGTGREWLWRHPRLAYQRVPHGSSYVALADTGGWDECFPSVTACEYPSAPWKGAAVQDHGELWSQTAALDIIEGVESVALRTRWRGVALPYSFTRTITLTANSARLHVDYSVENLAEAPLNFVWCIHPLLAIEPDMELHLPGGARFNVGGQFPPGTLSRDHDIAYPFSAPGLSFPALPAPSTGAAIKLWSDPLPADEGWAALRARDGELRMTWDTALLPQVAAWMNFGAWAGDGGAPYFNLGLEPCIGAQDSLAEAVTQRNLFAALPPRGSRAWWLEIELSA